VASEMSSDTGAASLSLILVDFQSLTTINKRFGRHIGNQSLGQVADAIKQALRGADILFRYEDDELIVLLTQTDLETACAVAKRISGRISEQVSAAGPSEEGRISVRIGVAAAPTDGVTVEALV